MFFQKFLIKYNSSNETTRQYFRNEFILYGEEKKVISINISSEIINILVIRFRSYDFNPCITIHQAVNEIALT